MMEQLGLDLDAPADNGAPRFSGEDAKRSVNYLIEQATRYGSSRSYLKLLGEVARFKQYKPWNALLAQLQRPGATFVLPPQQWESRYGRVIKPGEQPIVMLPFGPVMFVYDVSQTEPLPGARPLPGMIEHPYAMNPIATAHQAVLWLRENAKDDGVRVSYVAAGSQSAGCIRHARAGLTQPGGTSGRPNAIGPAIVPIRYEIEVNQAQSDTEKLATLAHELGHLYCGHLGTHDAELWPARPGLAEQTREIEAESVAWLLCERLDARAKMPPHLHQYVSADEPLPDYDLERILTAAGRVVEMSGGWAPRRRKKGTPAATGRAR
ncbi:ImmA/IrrE family metallo-endopeptidase [Georgenia yuyongxinii]